MPRIENHRESAVEKRLVARFQAGEAEALSVLFELHVERVFAYARHLLGNREDAEEVTQEAFLRAFERAASFRGECPFRGWLFGIARNLCFDRLRQPRLLLLEPDEAERNTDAGRGAAQMETQALVRRALAELPEEYRLVLTLCDVEEWEAREVAAALEKSLPALKSLLYRARRALRARLTELWDEGEPTDDAL
ncbi:MAG TPA: RNA polymerase sigma factor [Chthonomonadaceae bacterium]|nr:RNA polymerase sigma factor [Chthonomonadaceae bacterium]